MSSKSRKLMITRGASICLLVDWVGSAAITMPALRTRLIANPAISTVRMKDLPQLLSSIVVYVVHNILLVKCRYNSSFLTRTEEPQRTVCKEAVSNNEGKQNDQICRSMVTVIFECFEYCVAREGCRIAGIANTWE